MRTKFQNAGVRVGAAAVGHKVRISVNRRLLVEQYSSDLLEQLAELEWLREQVRQAELDPQQLLSEFKAYRQQRATTARQARRRAS
jgi:hypothetical protein